MVAMLERPAQKRWSTGDVEARHALAYWVDTICKSFLEIDIDSPDHPHFHGQLEQTGLGPAMLYVIEADTQHIKRTPARIAQSRYPGYFLLQLRAGQMRFQQHGRECYAETGDIVLVDCNAPYQLECHLTTRTVAVRFAQDWLKNWIPAPHELACRPIRREFAWSNVLAAVFANLPSTLNEDLALPPGAIAEQIAVLLALAAGPEIHAASPSDKLLARVRRTIRDRCHEPGLDPAAVADAHGISKRYLHYLCAHASTTFGAELMRMRLELAHRLLSDRRYTTLSICEVAARSGFIEPSHFARRFRKAYGQGPTTFRAARG
jgi:AraC-like DNA-binding protein